MADREVTIRLKLSADQFTSGASQVTGELQRIEGQAGQTQGAFSKMGGELQGVFAGASIAGMVGLVGNLGAAGREAYTAEASFRAMAGGLGDATSIMQGLVGAGQGLIDDTDLYKAGALALSTQAVTTSGDLQRLVTDGTKLGLAFSGDAATGVSDLSTALEHQSYRSLAGLGISIQATKDRVKELTGAGMDMAAAFSQAALEQADVATGKLGTVAFSATERLNVALGDVRDTLGEIVANGIEAGAQLVALPGLLIQQQQQAAQTKQTADLAGYGRGTVASQTIDQDFKDKLGTDFVSKFMIETLQNVNENPDVANQAHLTGKQVAEYVAQGYAELDPNTVYGLNDMLFGGDNLPAAQATARQYIQGLVTYAFDQNREFMGAAATGTQQQQAAAAQAKATASAYSFGGDYAGIYRQQAYSEVNNGASAAEQRLNGLLGRAANGAGVNMLDTSKYAEARGLIDDFSSFYTQAQTLHDQKILTDAQFEPLKNANTEMDGLIKQAEQFKKNFDDVSAMHVPELLGQGTTAAGGDLAAMIKTYAGGAGGLNGDQLTNFQDLVDQASGAQNDLSETLSSKVVPELFKIGETFGKTALTDAITALTKEMQDAKQEGRNPNLSAQTMGYADSGGAGGGTFTVKPGEGVNAIMARTGMSAADIRRIAGAGHNGVIQPGTFDGGGSDLTPLPGTITGPGGATIGPRSYGALPTERSYGALSTQVGTKIGPDTIGGGMAAQTLADNMTTVADQTKAAADNAIPWEKVVQTLQGTTATLAGTDLPAATTAADGLYTKFDASANRAKDMQDTFKDLTSHVQVINIQIKANAPPWLTQLLNLADIVRAQGGHVPGTPY